MSDRSKIVEALVAGIASVDRQSSPEFIAQAALLAIEGGGFVIVPREPTPSMYDAAEALYEYPLGSSTALYAVDCDTIWKAMVSTFLQQGGEDQGSSVAESAAPLASEQAGQYRKKPIVIEAYRFENKVGPDTRPPWVIAAEKDRTIIFINSRNRPPHLTIGTLEGDMRAEIGDWIIKGVKGEIYPCKPDIFAMTYEPITPTDHQGEG